MIKLGLSYGCYDQDNLALFDSLLVQAQVAEAAGVDSIWVPDHLMQAPAVASVDDPMVECYTTSAPPPQPPPMSPSAPSSDAPPTAAQPSSARFLAPST